MLPQDWHQIPEHRFRLSVMDLLQLVSLYIGMGIVLNVGLQSSVYNNGLMKKEMDRKEVTYETWKVITEENTGEEVGSSL